MSTLHLSTFSRVTARTKHDVKLKFMLSPIFQRYSRKLANAQPPSQRVKESTSPKLHTKQTTCSDEVLELCAVSRPWTSVQSESEDLSTLFRPLLTSAADPITLCTAWVTAEVTATGESGSGGRSPDSQLSDR